MSFKTKYHKEDKKSITTEPGIKNMRNIRYSELTY